MKNDFAYKLQVCADTYIRDNRILDTPQNRQLVIDIMIKSTEMVITHLQKIGYK